MTTPSRPAPDGDDRELWAVLVALEPLDDRKWNYLDIADRTFHADALLDQPLSSGERVLVQVAASLWNTGTVDLGYIAAAMGGRHQQAIIDAIAIRAGHPLASDTTTAITQAATGPRPQRGPALGPISPVLGSLDTSLGPERRYLPSAPNRNDRGRSR